MKAKRRTARLSAPLLAVCLILLSGCSGSTEDVRETFCKNLAIAQLGVERDVAWGETSQTVRPLDHALITVRVKGGGRTSCWFAHDAEEETVDTHIDPLSAFSTLPYQLSVNGRVLSERATLDAVNAEQIRQGKAAVEYLRQAAHR